MALDVINLSKSSDIVHATHDTLSEYRFEIKVPMEKAQYEELHGWMLGAPYKPLRTYPPRTIHSVYCDDIELNDYFDNVSGIANRRKVRLRWYGNAIDKLSLERKLKSNKMNRKDVVRLKNPDRIYPYDVHSLYRLVEINTLPPGYDLRHLKPVVEISYERKYFELAPGVRMTIDTHIRARRLSPTPSTREMPSPVYSVLELKYPEELKDVARNCLKNLPFRVFRHSKYVIGIDSTYR